MNTLELFKKEHILFLNQVSTKEECLEKIANHATSLGLGDDTDSIFEGFMIRENECTTGFGDGFAIPHTRCEAIKKAGIIVVKNEIGMSWIAMDELPVYIAIALLVPTNNEGNLHIQLLSSLSRKLINKQFKEALRIANTIDDIYTIILDALEGK